MKKNIPLIIIVASITFFVTVIGFCALFTFVFTHQSMYELFLNSPQPSHGESMEPTILDGSMVYLDTWKDPVENDVISITCSKEGCPDTGSWGMTKRLIKIDEKDCWWVEGDNKEKSYDSRNYGWLCPNERKYWGVVTMVKVQ